MLRLITPSLRLLRAGSQTAWVLCVMAWEMVVWGNVRAGSISLANTPRSFRLLIRLGLWLTMGLLGMLLFSNIWRLISPLQPLLFNIGDLAGNYIPAYFVPVTIGLLALAWAYVLCGALHAHWAAKLIILLLFGLFDFSFGFHIFPELFMEISLLVSGLGFSLWSSLALIIHTGGWLVLLAILIWRWRRPVRLGLEFPLMLTVCAALFYSGYFSTQLGSNLSQSEAVSSGLQLTQALSLISTILTPFLLIAGVEVVTLGMGVTENLMGRLRRLPQAQAGWGQRLWQIALLAFLVWRLITQWVMPLVQHTDLAFSWGAVLIVLLFLVVFAWVRRAPLAEELPVWVIPVVALAFYASLFALQIISVVVAGLGVAVMAFGGEADTLVKIAMRGMLFLGEWNEIFVGGLAMLVGAGLWLRRRLQRKPFPSATLYLFLFSLWIVWWVFTRASRPLGMLTFHYTELATCMTPVLLGLLLVSAAARRLKGQTLLQLTAAALLLWLLELQDFLSNPLSPAFGLLGAQTALVSVSIFLNVMSAGNRFALNTELDRFPRYARSMLYFGYALLTVISINWLAAAHDVSAMATNDQITQNGYLAIGLPLAFWALIAGSQSVLGEAPPAAEATSRDEAFSANSSERIR